MNPDSLPADWQAVLGPEFSAPYFLKLKEFVAKERETETIYPSEENVFRALKETPLSAVKAVILGQDPYIKPGEAEGLSFSVPVGQKIPQSLNNVFKELQTDLDLPKPTSGSLIPWAERGVLLINAVLTVRQGLSDSHKGKGWEQFTDAIIRAVVAKEEPVAFLLWGAKAQVKLPLIKGSHHHVITAPHPSPLARDPVTKKALFLGSKPFSRANAVLTEPLDWSLP